LPEKCCNPGTLIHTIALLEAAPKDEEKRTLQMIHFFPMLPERKKAWQEMVQILDLRVIPKVTLSSALSLTLEPLVPSPVSVYPENKQNWVIVS
jgi:hypothetical protein